ncbi:MAG: cytochrome c oxidase accessory protein CcoG [Planctomycetota bacterium]|nr:MAG: cytochrome c oxidase accessory protein CcoG [Planctomycetota bacterium]
MTSEPQFLEAPEQVLSTLNPDGTRRWLHPRLAKGRWWRRRRLVAWFLIALFNLLPWIRIGGKPAILLDVANRDFAFFGASFRPTETPLLALFLLAVFLGIFYLTALVGRAWCGWGCPQTVYLEFLYRPLERLIEGKSYSSGRRQAPLWRKVVRLGVFTVVSAHLAHTFLAYFVGGPTVFRWSLGSPAEHPVGFALVWVVTGLMLIDFAWFREQLCILACPYGRLQSVLLDRNSLIIGYDAARGERRGKMGERKGGTGGFGDCVDCGLCVAACPTGIDIRDGLQMECVACAECIDACDSVMARTGRAPGLIRYASQESLAGGRTRWLRPRTVAYPLVLGLILALFLGTLLGRASAMVQIRRSTGAAFELLPDGRVRNLATFRIDNRTDQERRYTISLPAGVEGMIPVNPVVVAAGDSGIAVVHLYLPREAFSAGKATIPITIRDGVDFEQVVEYPALGPL